MNKTSVFVADDGSLHRDFKVTAKVNADFIFGQMQEDAKVLDSVAFIMKYSRRFAAVSTDLELFN
jgi:hypothetical protein